MEPCNLLYHFVRLSAPVTSSKRPSLYSPGIGTSWRGPLPDGPKADAHIGARRGKRRTGTRLGRLHAGTVIREPRGVILTLRRRASPGGGRGGAVDPGGRTGLAGTPVRGCVRCPKRNVR